MDDQCCGSNKPTDNTKDDCCSSSDKLNTKQEDSSCCTNHATTPLKLTIKQEGDSCCSNNLSKDSVNKIEKSSCCSSSHSNKTNLEIDTCSCSTKSVKEDTCSVTSNCCSDNEQSTEQANSNSFSSGEKMAYRVYGMDCAACGKTIEKGLSKLKDINEVTVNFSTAKMQVAANKLDAFIPIESEIKKLGYSAEPLNQKSNIKTFDIAGMDCSSCAKSIENHLNTLDFVKSASVNFSTGKMKIEHSGNVDDIISEVSKIGYEASLPSINKVAEKKNSKGENNLIVFSGILIALGFIGSLYDISTWISTILYAIAMIISGFKPVKSAFYSIKSRSLDMNVLMSAAAIGAAIIGEWFEGATVVWLFAIGNFLQTKSIERTRNSIRNLMDLAPQEAWVQVGSEIIKKPVENITVGEMIIVKPGDKIPLDGEIIQGESSINQASITGESIPVDKTIGDTVYAGTI
ncbi:MAG TPA: cation transporter, partial [Rummeliibacillus sp.]|nr:cation transporter [Rummeliibacillus sp.]